ncbi:MAG: hypothetical protein HWN81_04425 [Candidatus Lokiarchaeota archaeon]|nr:hypothetical protein [Candidatus Lokiarchaeota archaeon]
MSKEKFFTDLKSIRKAYYEKHYYEDKKSWSEIAKMLGTYPNKVKRDAKNLGIKSRDKSEAQKIALEKGRTSHPTAGKKHSDETKFKISESQGAVWDSMDESELENRSDIARKCWNKKTDEQKAEFLKKGGQAIQEAARTGSKVEKEMFEYLVSKGYRVDRHKEHILKNEKFHIDLYIRNISMAIEVDGPMHFSPVYGEEKLKKRQAADLSKNGLILSSGMVLVRVKLVKRGSQRFHRYIMNELQKIIDSVEKTFPEEGKRYFEI